MIEFLGFWAQLWFYFIVPICCMLGFFVGLLLFGELILLIKTLWNFLHRKSRISVTRPTL
jgi:hypothetical protein